VNEPELVRQLAESEMEPNELVDVLVRALLDRMVDDTFDDEDRRPQTAALTGWVLLCAVEDLEPSEIPGWRLRRSGPGQAHVTSYGIAADAVATWCD
jgi:hypothetical protein